jgi:hypothetical protein
VLIKSLAKGLPFGVEAESALLSFGIDAGGPRAPVPKWIFPEGPFIRKGPFIFRLPSKGGGEEKYGNFFIHSACRPDFSHYYYSFLLSHDNKHRTTSFH